MAYGDSLWEKLVFALETGAELSFVFLINAIAVFVPIVIITALCVLIFIIFYPVTNRIMKKKAKEAEDLASAARLAAAQAYTDIGLPKLAEQIRAGRLDGTTDVQSAIYAIKNERSRNPPITNSPEPNQAASDALAERLPDSFCAGRSRLERESRDQPRPGSSE